MPSSRKKPRQPHAKVRRMKKAAARHEIKAKDGIPLPSHDPALAIKEPKPVSLNRHQKYKRVQVDLTDPLALSEAIEKLQSEVANMKLQEQHYQPCTSYFHKKSCQLEGAEKQLEELKTVLESIRQARSGS